MNIPKDPMILLSYINTQLRDFYSTLEDLCQSLNIDEKSLRKTLATIDYHYRSDLNKFC